MTPPMRGLHHVTALASAAQPAAEFHMGVLRRRLVKRTVDFEDPSAEHLYFGDAFGAPGSLLSLFALSDAGRGRAGPGMANAVAWAAPPGGLMAWMLALAEEAVDFEGPFTRFGAQAIALADPDGLRVELVELAGEGLAAAPAVEGLHSVTLTPTDPDAAAAFLRDVFGWVETGAAGARRRFAAPDGARGAVVDLLAPDGGPGEMGAGVIHHVAFRAADRAEQAAWRARLEALGLEPTPVKDRRYFHSVYFRAPGGVLFEIATDPPGFAVDEPADALGRALVLPPWLERRRPEIERRPPPFRTPE